MYNWAQENVSMNKHSTSLVLLQPLDFDFDQDCTRFLEAMDFLDEAKRVTLTETIFVCV